MKFDADQELITRAFAAVPCVRIVELVDSWVSLAILVIVSHSCLNSLLTPWSSAVLLDPTVSSAMELFSRAWYTPTSSWLDQSMRRGFFGGGCGPVPVSSIWAKIAVWSLRLSGSWSSWTFCKKDDPLETTDLNRLIERAHLGDHKMRSKVLSQIEDKLRYWYRTNKLTPSQNWRFLKIKWNLAL